MKIKVLKQPEYKKGSALAEWFAAIKGFHKKDVENFVMVTTKKPPILNKHGKGEAPLGWLRYFERKEVIVLS